MFNLQQLFSSANTCGVTASFSSTSTTTLRSTSSAPRRPAPLEPTMASSTSTAPINCPETVDKVPDMKRIAQESTCPYYTSLAWLICSKCKKEVCCKRCHNKETESEHLEMISQQLAGKLKLGDSAATCTENHGHGHHHGDECCAAEEADDDSRHITQGSVTHVKCKVCDEVQPLSAECQSCKTKFGKMYTCLKCPIFESNKKIEGWHCEKCLCCRAGNSKDFVHCDNCDLCISKNSKHRCLNTECSICLESFKTSYGEVLTLECGHRIHAACTADLCSCPVCRRPFANKNAKPAVSASRPQRSRSQDDFDMPQCIIS